MAAQAEGPVSTPSPQDVGNAFVEQYYHILHQSPESVYRFYQDSSVLSRPDANGEMTSVTTMQGINDKILSLNYKEYLAEIKTADAQQSLGEGVTVLVTGCLTGRDNVRKKFVQSFFLAPQEKGFYVLNDVVRYVEELETFDSSSRSVTVSNITAPSPPLEPDSVEPAKPLDQSGTADETSLTEDPNNGAEVCDPSDNDGSVVEDEVIAPPPSHPVQSENIAATSVSPVAEGDVPKQSYASIVKVTRVSPATSPILAPPTHNVRVTPNSEQQSRVSSKPAASVEPVASTGETAPESSNEHVDAEGHSVYVRNLPLNATPEQLEQVFKTFGPIKQGGIQVRSNKQGFCYGFVEFENATSMTNALEVSPITIGNRKAVIEEKRTTTRVPSAGSSGGGRGRGNSGFRGGGNSGFRGGDSYRGGRSGGNYGVGGGRGGGYGRNGPGGGEYSSRNRRGGGGGGGGMGSYQRVDQSPAGSGRGGGGGAGPYQQK